MNTLVHNLNIRHNSWHAKWYRHWATLGGKPATYRENLCRYVWVLLVRAPLRWFFKGRMAREVSPWLAAMIVCLVVVAFFVSIYLAIPLVVIFGGIATWLLLMQHNPRLTRLLAERARNWGVKLAHPVVWMWGRFKLEDKLTKFGRRITIPMGILLLAVCVLMLIYETELALIILAVIGGIVVIIGIIIGGVVVVERIQYRQRIHLAATPRRVPTPLKHAYEGVADTVKLGATYVSTKKKGSRICPFLDFENSSA